MQKASEHTANPSKLRAPVQPYHIDSNQISFESDPILVHRAQASFFVGRLFKALPLPEVPIHEHALMETVWLLLTSVIMVPLICKLPGGSAVLGFLVRWVGRSGGGSWGGGAWGGTVGTCVCLGGGGRGVLKVQRLNPN